MYAVESNALSSEDSVVERTDTAPMTMRRGSPVSLTQPSDLSAPESMKGIAIFGERGTLSLTGDRSVVSNLDGEDARGVVIVSDPIRPYARELKEFSHHIRMRSLSPQVAFGKAAASQQSKRGMPRSVREGRYRLSLSTRHFEGTKTID